MLHISIVNILSVKLKLLDRSVLPQFDFRNTRWPPSRLQLKRENALQRRLIASLQRLQPATHASVDDFIARRRRVAARTANDVGLWSKRHVSRCAAWREHPQRARNSESWPAILLKHNDTGWLNILRAVRIALGVQGTGTRLGPGRPQPRWDESVLQAIEG